MNIAVSPSHTSNIVTHLCSKVSPGGYSPSPGYPTQVNLGIKRSFRRSAVFNCANFSFIIIDNNSDKCEKVSLRRDTFNSPRSSSKDLGEISQTIQLL